MDVEREPRRFDRFTPRAVLPGRMRIWWALWLVGILLSGLPLVAAHEDVDGLSGTYTLSPGEPLEFVREVHYHRLVAQVDPLGEGSAHLLLTVFGPDGNETVVATGNSLRANMLIACCGNSSWTPHTIRLETFALAQVEVDVDIRLLHDNVAIVAYDAEVGAGWQTALIVGGLTTAGIVRAKTRRAPDPFKAAEAQRRGLVALGAAWAGALLMLVIGWLRFGGGPFAATLSATEPIPQFGGPFLNPHAVLLLVLMIVWLAAVLYWGTARRHTDVLEDMRDDRLGLSLMGGIVLVTVVAMLEYRAFFWLFAVAVVPLLVLGYGMWPRKPAQQGQHAEA